MIKLFTDSDTDLTLLEAKKYGYELISMPYVIDDKIYYPYKEYEVFDYKPFYEMLRNGVIPKTCALNIEDYRNYFEKVFQNGDDILYVHFSRAMTATFDSMDALISELKEKYPERKFYAIDTKAITIGSNIIVKEIGDMYLKGESIENIMKWAEKEVDKFACYFYADDLKFFKASGRVSNLAAVFGSLIGIKPIIYIGTDGKMTNIGKEHGRTKALKKLVDTMEEIGDDIKNHRIVIGHSDALDIALELGKMITEKFGEGLNIEYVVVNPTAGSHCGPSGVGVAFHSMHR